MAKRPLPSPELLRQLLRYEPETGKLFWRERPASMFRDNAKWSAEHMCRCWNTRRSGKEAFTACRNGYRVGAIFGLNIDAHRVIVAMETGEWPECVDHDNRRHGDNRLANLNSGTQSSNLRNCRLRKDSTSGVPGVYQDKKTGRWSARIHDLNKRPVNLGTFGNKADAIAARRAAEVEHGYHPNHGKLIPARPDL